jgi:aryl-alcohol dehydrogenase-like predicted oxidoreductase
MAPLPSFTPDRPLGRTGFTATRVGAGDLADRSLGLEACVRLLQRVLDAGVNVVDTAPNYEAGFSEEVVGRALEGRGGVFLIDKVDHLDRPVAPQVEESLRRLGRESADLFAFHDVSTPEAWEGLVRRGALEELEGCVRAGKCRLRGISSHHPDVLRAALGSGRFDVVMLPVGPYVHPRYVDEVLPLARARGVGTVSFKTFGGGKLLGDTEGYGRPLAQAPDAPLPRLGVEECVHATLTMGPDVALLGMSSEEEQDAALAAAASFRPLSPAALEEVLRRAALAVQGKGRVWWNPDGR